MMDNEFQHRKNFFERQAEKTLVSRKKKKYYWNQISSYINYFTHNQMDILEVGCGSGELLANIQGKRKVGIDFSNFMVEKAKELHPDYEFYVMEAENLKLEGSFDLIILSNLVGSLGDVQGVFEQLLRLSHPRTKIIITYYNFLWEPVLAFGEWLGIKSKDFPQNWLSQSDIQNLLHLAGFDVYRKTSGVLIPINIPLISWLSNKFLARMPILNLLCLNNYTFARPKPESGTVTQTYSVSVVIPARNEEGNIENALLRLPKMGKHTEVIFIEGNSTDNTWAKIEEMAEKYKDHWDIKIGRQAGKGKADAVRKGFSMANGDILMILDGDLTVPPEELPKFYEALAQAKGDFINGTRLVYPMDKEAMRFLNLLGNKFFSLLFTWLLDQRFKDTLCGTKVIFRKDYQNLVQNQSYFGDFDPFGDFDLIFGAHKLNLAICEVPIRYRERTYGETNISRFRHGLILLKMCLFASGKIKFIGR
jgi:SAM-dependent methyltransferase